MESVFISYGGSDEEFAERLNQSLIEAGVSTFFFPEDAMPGQKLHRMMRDNINLFERVVFICSETSLNRPGVLNELEEALQREARDGGTQVLIPINLDNYVFEGWNPPRSGLKQAILDRVVGNFVGADANERRFAHGFNKLLKAIGATLELDMINSEVILSLNENGSSCLVELRRTFVTYVHRSEMLYSGMHSSGTIVPVSTNFGTIQGIEREGGNHAILVKFDQPLPILEPITHSLFVEHKDAFTQEEDNYSVHRLIGARKFSITVNFPKTRPVKTAYVKINETGRRDLPSDEPFISPTGDRVHFEVAFPPKGSYYNLVWRW